MKGRSVRAGLASRSKSKQAVMRIFGLPSYPGFFFEIFGEFPEGVDEVVGVYIACIYLCPGRAGG